MFTYYDNKYACSSVLAETTNILFLLLLLILVGVIIAFDGSGGVVRIGCREADYTLTLVLLLLLFEMILLLL